VAILSLRTSKLGGSLNIGPGVNRLDIAQVPVAILAGGLATRLVPITSTIPKVLVEVAGRPFIEHQLALLRRNGIRSAVLCVGHLGEQVRDHLGDGAALGLELQYSFDGPRLLGTGGALRRALPLLGENFWVLYGDSYLNIDFGAVLADFNKRGVPALMTVLRNNNQWDQSNLIFREGSVVRYSKRVHDPEMAYIDYGVTLLRCEVIERLPERQPCDLADLYTDLASRGLLAGFEVTQRFYEIGSPRGLAETQAYLSGGSGGGTVAG
jgi:NDP-sugar pyrophosphorylase family protein